MGFNVICGRRRKSGSGYGEGSKWEREHEEELLLLQTAMDGLNLESYPKARTSHIGLLIRQSVLQM